MQTNPPITLEQDTFLDLMEDDHNFLDETSVISLENNPKQLEFNDSCSYDNEIEELFKKNSS